MRGKKRKAEKQIIKGLSTSFGPLGYDVIKEKNRDYMHTVLLTIVKRFVSRWIDTAYRHSPYYCGDKLSIRDSRRANIKLPKLPNHVSGIPRSVNDRVHYKVSEDRTWLLYYSLPVVGGILIILCFW